MSNKVKVVQPHSGVQSTIVVSNTDLVTTMVVKLMKKLKADLLLLKEKRVELEKSILKAPTEKAIDIARILVDTDVNLIGWKNLLKALNPTTDLEIDLKERDIERYISRSIEFSKEEVSEIEFEITTLEFDFVVKNDRRTAPYFYNVSIGDLRKNEFPVQINFKMEVDKTELSKVKKEITKIERKINDRQSIQDEATAAITEATIANNPDLKFLAGIGINEQNLLDY